MRIISCVVLPPRTAILFFRKVTGVPSAAVCSSNVLFILLDFFNKYPASNGYSNSLIAVV